MTSSSKSRILHELFTIATRVFGIGAGLISSAITARSLGAADRGVFFYVAALAGVLAQFGHLGTPGANTFFCAPEPRLARQLLRWNLLLGVVAAAVLSLGFLLITGVSGLQGLAPAQGGLWLVPITVVVLLLAMLGPLLAGLHAFAELNGLQIAYQGLLIVGFITVAALAPTAENFLAVSAVGGLCAVAGYVAVIRRRSPIETGTSELTLRIWLAYGGRVFAILILGALMPRVGIFFVKAGGTPAEMGYYSIALQAFDALVLVPASLATILLPTILRARNHTWESCRSEVLRMSAIAGVLAAASALAMPFAVRLVFGPEFAPVTPIALAFLPGFVALSVVTIASQYLAALGYPRVVTVNWFVALGVAASITAVLVPIDGARGAALAASVAYGLLAALMLHSAFRALPRAGLATPVRVPASA